jgi:enoyl-CoA hydratase/carnithine racemase
VRTGLFAGTRRFNDDDTAKVLVLTGAGEKAFCAGGDLKEMADTELTVPPPDFAPQFGRNIDVAKPTIAAVNGVAWAGGFLLAQCCDLCIAADTATFAISEVKVGRGAPWAAPLSWLIPPRIALRILLTGDPITAQRGYEIGLVNEVVPLAELRSRAQQVADGQRDYPRGTAAREGRWGCPGGVRCGPGDRRTSGVLAAARRRPGPPDGAGGGPRPGAGPRGGG